MATLKARDIALVAARNGFKGKALETAVAVALAESSGRTDVVNSIGCCVGLWQINVKAHKQYTAAAMKDPDANAKAAYAISSGGSTWKPWEAYTNGAYLLYVPTAKAAVSSIGDLAGGTTDWGGGDFQGTDDNPLIPDSIENLGRGITDVAAFPAKVLAWISDRNNIIRIAKVAVGAGVVLVAVAVLARPVVEPVAKTAAKVVK